MLTIKLSLVEFNAGEYKGVLYSNIQGRYNGKILKFKLDRNKVGDISNLVDHQVEADLDITPGAGRAATIRVVAVRALESYNPILH